MNQSTSKLGFNGAWSMAFGGMVGGGIFSTLGVVVGYLFYSIVHHAAHHWRNNSAWLKQRKP